MFAENRRIYDERIRLESTVILIFKWEIRNVSISLELISLAINFILLKLKSSIYIYIYIYNKIKKRIIKTLLFLLLSLLQISSPPWGERSATNLILQFLLWSWRNGGARPNNPKQLSSPPPLHHLLLRCSLPEDSEAGGIRSELRLLVHFFLRSVTICLFDHLSFLFLISNSCLLFLVNKNLFVIM